MSNYFKNTVKVLLIYQSSLIKNVEVRCIKIFFIE